MTDIAVRAVAASKTAVVKGPIDILRFMPMLDAVYAFIRGGDTDVKQTGQNIALYGPGGMEVGVEVDHAFEPAGDVVSSELPAGRVASAIHTTGYGDLHVTYSAISAWCEEHGHAVTGIQWEIYSDPDDDDHVDVEICYLLS